MVNDIKIRDKSIVLFLVDHILKVSKLSLTLVFGHDTTENILRRGNLTRDGDLARGDLRSRVLHNVRTC